MKIFMALITNKALVAAAAGWFIAQVSKIILEMITGKFTLERMTGSGGMPSTHATLVSALAAAAFINDGPGSTQFATALFFAFIVIFDSVGVRYITGRQSARLNHLDPAGEHLPEQMGHTLPEVIVGMILGTAVGIVTCIIIG
jgi:acid phosphatase family membrane protein YuiD